MLRCYLQHGLSAVPVSLSQKVIEGAAGNFVVEEGPILHLRLLRLWGGGGRAGMVDAIDAIKAHPNTIWICFLCIPSSGRGAVVFFVKVAGCTYIIIDLSPSLSLYYIYLYIYIYLNMYILRKARTRTTRKSSYMLVCDQRKGRALPETKTLPLQGGGGTGHECFLLMYLPSLKLTANAPENGWLNMIVSLWAPAYFQFLS